jgi:Mn2+/Fe2+ NRAMP family transporter
LRKLGPGLITGAADDDPSGIATYSVAGAQHGTALLWTALVTWPLMASVQFMYARVGMVTGRGLAGMLRPKFPKPITRPDWLVRTSSSGKVHKKWRRRNPKGAETP